MASEEYISASEVAKQHGVSMSTMRRRIAEGKLFPSAKKERIDIGERWFILRSETKNLTLREISPKLFQEKREEELKSTLQDDQHTDSSNKPLEDRVARLERQFIKILDALDQKSI